MKNKINVVIDGKVISLRSDESAEHMQKVALYVDKKIAELKGKNLSAVVDERVRSILIAINLADDYFKIKDKHTVLESETKKLERSAAKYEKENIDLAKQLAKVQAELTKVSTEFEEFLRDFDNPEEVIVPLTKAEPEKKIRKAAN